MRHSAGDIQFLRDARSRGRVRVGQRRRTGVRSPSRFVGCRPSPPSTPSNFGTILLVATVDPTAPLGPLSAEQREARHGDAGRGEAFGGNASVDRDSSSIAPVDGEGASAWVSRAVGGHPSWDRAPGLDLARRRRGLGSGPGSRPHREFGVRALSGVLRAIPIDPPPARVAPGAAARGRECSPK